VGAEQQAGKGEGSSDLHDPRVLHMYSRLVEDGRDEISPENGRVLLAARKGAAGNSGEGLQWSRTQPWVKSAGNVSSPDIPNPVPLTHSLACDLRPRSARLARLRAGR
jgi:hypothetical protein